MYAVVVPVEKRNKKKYKIVRLFFKKSKMSHHLGVAMRKLYLEERYRLFNGLNRRNGYTYVAINRYNNDIITMIERRLNDFYNNMGKTIAVMDLKTREIITQKERR